MNWKPNCKAPGTERVAEKRNDMSSNKLKERLLGKTADLAKNAAASPRPSIAEQRNITMPGQLGAFRLEAERYVGQIEDRDRQIADLKAQLERSHNTGGMDLPLDRLIEIPGRKRTLTAEQYNELKANLKKNPLVTPITVRVHPEGFEIVSGHNRVQIFRELERGTIKAVLDESDDDQAELNAFYANLLQPNLPDYEKFVKFQQIKARQPELTLQDLGAQAGISKSSVHAILQFEELPDAVHDMLKQAPAILGWNAASALVQLTKKGREKAVIAAVEKLVSGEITDQSQAVKLAATDAEQVKPAAKANTLKIRLGKTTYCDVRRAENVIRLNFASPEEAAEIEKAVTKVLEERVKALSAKR